MIQGSKKVGERSLKRDLAASSTVRILKVLVDQLVVSREKIVFRKRQHYLMIVGTYGNRLIREVQQKED